MKQTEEIKAMILGMMAQEMENYNEAVSNGELNEDKTPHMMLFDGGPFQNELAIDNTIDKLLKIKLEEN